MLHQGENAEGERLLLRSRERGRCGANEGTEGQRHVFPCRRRLYSSAPAPASRRSYWRRVRILSPDNSSGLCGVTLSAEVVPVWLSSRLLGKYRVCLIPTGDYNIWPR
jgi:hypothetical protein